MKFQYMNLVRVKRGFYEGLEGYTVGVKEYGENYDVELVTTLRNEVKTVIVSISHIDLERVEKCEVLDKGDIVIENLTVSASGLKRMAEALQKAKKTKGNVVVDAYITIWKDGGKVRKTIGIKIK